MLDEPSDISSASQEYLNGNLPETARCAGSKIVLSELSKFESVFRGDEA
jgi:hypothetical protein